MSADHVFSLDLRPVLRAHRDTGAECTLVTAEVTRAEAQQNAVVVTNNRRRVTQFQYKPSSPKSGTVATEIFVYETAVLLRTLGRLRVELSLRAVASGEQDGAGQDETDSDLGDLGEHLLPALVDRGKVYTHDIGGYRREVGRPAAYLAAHRDLLAGKIDVFDHPERPVLTMSTGRLPARVDAGAVIVNSLLGAGSRVSGTVEGSVLGTDVVVHRGAVVRNSVLFDGVVVHPRRPRRDGHPGRGCAGPRRRGDRCRHRPTHGPGRRHRPGRPGQPDRPEGHDRQGRSTGARHHCLIGPVSQARRSGPAPKVSGGRVAVPEFSEAVGHRRRQQIAAALDVSRPAGQ